MIKQQPVLCVLVVGFHHKKGCQIEFCYPPMKQQNEQPTNCETFAIVDGSHNFGHDTVFFNLPSSSHQVYGVSCYRQIPVEKLKNRTADFTRSTVQKSVTALTSIPIYGYIEVKLSLIANIFFEQGDFESTDILMKFYDQLNACLMDNEMFLGSCSDSVSRAEWERLGSSQSIYHVGLRLRQQLLKWRHKLLILFKMVLLQRKVICFASPVQSMCELIVSLASLHPQLLESGFQSVACVQTSKSQSPELSVHPQKIEVGEDECKRNVEDEINLVPENVDHDVKQSLEGINQVPLSRETSVDALSAILFPLSTVDPAEVNFPMSVFKDGCLCLPYLSLPYMDMLSDPSVTGYLIGTSNILFQQKKNLADVLIDVENGQIDVPDLELRRQLQLTTEDLRFVDFVLRHAQSPKESGEGGDRWIRNQFQGYLIAMLRTSLLPEGSKECDHFNSLYMTGLRRTNCHKDWVDRNPRLNSRPPFDTIPIGHPFSGTLSVQDVRLKFTHSMQNTESGRKLNQAISQAKGALTNWWSGFTAPATIEPSKAEGNMIIEEDAEDVLVILEKMEGKDNNTVMTEKDTERKDVDGKGTT